MKCLQKLCQRTKNLQKGGNCNVCEDAIVSSTKALEKGKVVKAVETDLKLMISTHEKLVKGETVEKGVVNVLLLGGVINILNQHDRISEMENKLKEVEVQNVTNILRVESLENWVVKQDEKIKDLENKLNRLDEHGEFVKESSQIGDIRNKVVGIEIEISGLKRTRQERVGKVDASDPVTKDNLNEFSKKCKLCKRIFSKNSDFEKHMADEHEQEKTFVCDVCGKKFILEWRANKHRQNHSEKPRPCKYSLNDQFCPFNEVGCMFEHGPGASDEPVIETILDVEDKESNVEVEYSQLSEYQCHLCHLQCKSRDDNFEHVKNEHEEYYQGILEMTGRMNSLID